LIKKIKKKFFKIGILGGTFDPPHIGHLNISKIAIKKLKLNKLIWTVTKKNPLKKNPYLSIAMRIKLSKSITKNNKKILVKNLDNKVKSSHTFNVLNYLKKYNKKNNLFFLIGADNLINFHKWEKWEKIPKLAKIVVFARPNYSKKAFGSVALKILKKNEWMYINEKKVNISSSLIRNF